MYNLVVPRDPDQTVILMQWAMAHNPTVEETTIEALRACYPIGSSDDGGLMGVWFLYNVRGHVADIGVSSIDPRFLTRRLLRAIFDLAFTHMKLMRLNAFIARNNKASRQFAERLGFIYEGTMKHALPDGQDLCVYRLLRVECKWIGTPNGRVN